MLKRNMFLIDFETTGLNPETDYPIEIGLLVLNRKLKILDTFECLIEWGELIQEHENLNNWKENYQGAFKVHNISIQEYKENTSKLFWSTVVQALNGLAHKYKIDNFYKPVFVSDNSIFEFQFLKKMYSAFGLNIFDYFHFSVYDTSLLLHNCETARDPISVHRAMGDVKMLYDELRKAYKELNWPLED